MKIDPGLKAIPTAPAVDTRPGESRALTSATGEQTQVSLSARASALNQMDTRLESMPVVDRSRVDAIKAALAAGTYTIHTDNIADNLLDTAKEILHVTK